MSLELGTSDNADMFLNDYLILVFDLTLDRGNYQGQTSHPENGNMSMELKFGKTIPKTITCQLYLDFGNSVINLGRNVTTDF